MLCFLQKQEVLGIIQERMFNFFLSQIIVTIYHTGSTIVRLDTRDVVLFSNISLLSEMSVPYDNSART